MSHFQTALVAEAVDGGWRLHAPLVYYSDVLGRTVTVPAGYCTDLASVPRIFRWIVPVANAKNRKAAVVHDYLCTHGDGVVKNQKQADKVFREALSVLGLGKFKSGALYYPVRISSQSKGGLNEITYFRHCVLALAACTQLNSLEITPEDNAMACLKGNTNAAGALLGANVSGITVELPASVDTSNWTAQDWKELAELCD
jgi:hypothetical protein